MNITLSHEQWGLLNTILPLLPFNEMFTVKDIYRDNVKGKTDGIPDYPSNEQFLDISKYLVESGYAIKGKPTSPLPFLYLKLTGVGEIVCSYGNMSKYLDSLSPLPLGDILTEVQSLILDAPYYGEFAVEITDPKTTVINSDQDLLQNVQAAISPKNRLIKRHEEWLRSESALQYLVNEGFAINRHDIQDPNKTYRQLTDKGRELKESGSVESYRQKISSRIASEAEEKAWRTETARRQHNLAEMQAELSKRQYWVNLSIAVSTSVVAILGGFQLFDYYEKHTISWQRLAYFSTGFGIALLVWLLTWVLRKTMGKR